MVFIYGQVHESAEPFWYVYLNSDRAQVFASNLLCAQKRASVALDILMGLHKGSFVSKRGDIVESLSVVHGAERTASNWPDEEAEDGKYRRVLMGAHKFETGADICK